MLSLFNVKEKKSPDLNTRRTLILKKIINLPHNNWLREEKQIAYSIGQLVAHFHHKALNFMEKGKNIHFVKVYSDLGMCLTHDESIHIIALFPSLIKKLRCANPIEGIAVLAHEIGHLYYGHHKKLTDPLQSQLEADIFAYSLGLGESLLDVLYNYSNYPQVEKRIFHLRKLLLEK